jgi:peptidyl-prolyl cis-trans isomerase C
MAIGRFLPRVSLTPEIAPTGYLCFSIPPSLFVCPGVTPFPGAFLGLDVQEADMEWRASHILVKDRPLAEDILRRVKKGASFESLAREFSTCPSKSSGGDLGWFGPGKMVAGFESAVKRLSPGSVGDVVQTQFGYHIIKCTGRKE